MEGEQVQGRGREQKTHHSVSNTRNNATNTELNAGVVSRKRRDLNCSDGRKRAEGERGREEAKGKGKEKSESQFRRF
jgi:hypothetical protein